MALRNWRRLDPVRPLETDDLTVQATVLGGGDGDWFTVRGAGLA